MSENKTKTSSILSIKKVFRRIFLFLNLFNYVHRNKSRISRKTEIHFSPNGIESLQAYTLIS